jgi:pantoate--beta-alanine ligase
LLACLFGERHQGHGGSAKKAYRTLHQTREGSHSIEIFRTISEMRRYSSRLRQSGKTIAFVPTMGFLHAGHLSLMAKGRQIADRVVVSLFINPTQFDPSEDLAAYPKDEARDLEMTRDAGVDAVFIPDAQLMYPDGFQTTVSLGLLPGHLCGLSRPGHFDGVATVVSKLLGIVRPHAAVFGEKDYQQLMIIRQMVRDLEMNVDVVGAPIVRESDGLAMSSRNLYLSASQRQSALSLYASLSASRRLVAGGEKHAGAIIRSAADRIRAEPETMIDYIAICDPQTLEAVAMIDGPVLMALAVHVGRARLIDNMILNP